MSEQSTKDFLLSKEGRRVLIGFVVIVVVVGAGIFWVYSKVFGEPEVQKPTAASVASKGAGSAKATSRGIAGDPTSRNLTPEAQETARDYNILASQNENLHPVPTFEDVEEVPVLPTDNNPEQRPVENANKDDGPTFEYQPPALPSDEKEEPSRTNKPRLTEAELKKLEEYRQIRREAARSTVELYREPPANGSMAFSSNDDKGKSEASNGDSRPPSVIAGTDEAGVSQVKLDPGASGSAQQCSTPLVKAGEIRYANNDIALSTDFRGPLRMTFLDGRLSGWQGMGTFELNEFGARMKAKVTKLIAPSGKTVSANGYVLDPNTTLWAVRSDVDRHIIYRYGGFGLGTILSAFSEIADARQKQSEVIRGDGTTVTQYREPDAEQITYRVLGEFSRLWEEAFMDNMDRPITVTLDPNTQVGVLFENTVCAPTGMGSNKTVSDWRDTGRSDPVLSLD